MKTLTLYQADAFTSELFKGNPAAVIPLQNEFLPDDLMQAIALENNLSETAFTLPRKDGSYDLRWFTPQVEVDFCGHATIATSHILRTELDAKLPLVFHTKIGRLEVGYKDGLYVMSAPPYDLEKTPITDEIRAAFPFDLIESFTAGGVVYVVAQSPASVENFSPDFSKIEPISEFGVGLTARTDGKFDFTSRMFFPAIDLSEDPVTGSAHAALGPYWSKRLDKKKLTARQASARGGMLYITCDEVRVDISGSAVTYMKGKISLP